MNDKDLEKIKIVLDQFDIPVDQIGNYVPDPSRSKRREIFAKAEDLSPEDLEVLTNLMTILHTTKVVEPKYVTDEVVEQLTNEILTIRSVQDMLNGRESALRQFVFDTVNDRLFLKGLDPETESGSLVCNEYGVRLSKEVSGGKPNLDVNKLKEVLESDQFSAITNLVEVSTLTYYPDGTKNLESTRHYEINEEALQRELVSGNIGIEQLQQATTLSTRKTAFYVRKIKPTEL